MMSRKGTTLEVRTKRSGVLPAFGVLIGGGVIIDYDAGHWHLLHHLFGRFSFIIALAVIIALTAAVAKISQRPAGYAKISSRKEEQ